MRFALVRDNVVENVILWDGEEEYVPDECYLMYEVSEEVSRGWTLVENVWTPPPPVDIQPPPELIEVEEAKQSALAELTSLGVSEATARTIVGLPPLDTQE